jgi:uncharacterized protein DUF2867
MRVSQAEFRDIDLRCHSLLADVELHDVWAIPLEGGGAERTMSDVVALSPLQRSSSRPVRALFSLRRELGRRLGWDSKRHDPSDESYLSRLSDEDRSRSVVVPGSRDQSGFRTLYVFPREALFEIRNATVHGFLASALIPRGDGFLLYWAIYVKPVSRLTWAYMAMIDPFRRLLLYPTMIREMQAAWSQEYGQRAA